MTIIGAAAVIAAVFSLSAFADEAFVTNQSSEDIAIVDLATGETRATVAVGGKPAGIVLSPDGAFAYVVSPESKTVSVLDSVSAVITRQIVLEGGPLGIAIHPDGQTLYVADWYEARIFVINAYRAR